MNRLGEKVKKCWLLAEKRPIFPILGNNNNFPPYTKIVTFTHFLMFFHQVQYPQNLSSRFRHIKIKKP